MRLRPVIVNVVVALAVTTVTLLLVGAPPVLAAGGRPPRRAARVGKRAFDTIQQAIDAALPGERVVVGRGVFRERLTISRAITFVGTGTVVDGVDDGIAGPCLVVASDGVTVQGVTFRNGTDQVSGDADGLRLLRCAFVNAAENAVDVAGDGVSVERSSFTGCGDTAVLVRGITARVAKCSFRNLAAGAVSLRGDDASVERCTVRAVASGASVDVVGDRATVQRTSVVGGAGDLISITGESALVHSCEAVGSASGDGIDVIGDGARVAFSFASAVAAGISVRGDAAIVEQSDVRYVTKAGISVVGDGPLVRENLVLFALGNEAGIFVDRVLGTVRGNLSSNRVEDCASEGIRLAGALVSMSSNRVVRCGHPSLAGILVEGDDCILLHDTVLACASHAVLVTGDRCALTDVLAADAARDGFLLLGDAAHATAIIARRCGGEGIENGGAGNVVESSTFLGNRLDVAVRDGLPFGSFATDNRYESGGPLFPAEIP